jgi:glycosyltransferase involved in cell wall biosynthesis
MSGIVVKAAEASKTILSTDVGSIAEYVINGENAFVVDDFDKFKIKLLHISHEISKSELKTMGRELNNFIVKEYNWDKISRKLIEYYRCDVYENS